MQNYRQSSHTVYDLKYQIVWISKYRKPILQGEIAKRARDLVREICKAKDVEIIKGHISKEHVHVFVSVPPPCFRKPTGRVFKRKEFPKIAA
jgi:putative transposase